MERSLAEALVEACDQAGIEAKVYEGYSGRGMYGRETTGISLEGNFTDLTSAVINQPDLFVNEDGNPKFEVDGFRTDSLGMGTIVY